MTLTEIPITTDIEAPCDATTTIYVCITCRRPGDSDDGPRSGAALADATACAAENTGIAVRRLRCLANCKRACSAAVWRAGSWTYVFGDLDPVIAATALVDGARLFSNATDGVMPWRGRPEALKRGLVARVPPIGYLGESE